MTEKNDQEWIREIIETCRYLCLATTDGELPWVAPLEFIHDENLDFYFLSPVDSRHARHIDANPAVAVAIFDTSQPEYSPDRSMRLRGVQILGTAGRIDREACPESVNAAIDALQPPMPPYDVFRIVPETFHVPKIVDGVNEREEVEMQT